MSPRMVLAIKFSPLLFIVLFGVTRARPSGNDCEDCIKALDTDSEQCSSSGSDSSEDSCDEYTNPTCILPSKVEAYQMHPDELLKRKNWFDMADDRAALFRLWSGHPDVQDGDFEKNIQAWDRYGHGGNGSDQIPSRVEDHALHAWRKTPYEILLDRMRYQIVPNLSPEERTEYYKQRREAMKAHKAKREAGKQEIRDKMWALRHSHPDGQSSYEVTAESINEEVKRARQKAIYQGRRPENALRDFMKKQYRRYRLKKKKDRGESCFGVSSSEH